MKKMISCIAALAIIAAAPAATVFAAESEPSTGAEASVTSETAYDVTDIRNITGRWKYQVAEEGENVTAGVTDNGFIDVKEDGTFIYTDLEGKTIAGTVKVDYDTFGGEFKVPFFAFYGDSVYELVIRTKIVETAPRSLKSMNAEDASLARAVTQARMLEALADSLGLNLVRNPGMAGHTPCGLPLHGAVPIEATKFWARLT